MEISKLGFVILTQLYAPSDQISNLQKLNQRNIVTAGERLE